MAARGLVIAGIGTEIGKTVASAIVCEALGADYWKPVASGSDDSLLDDATMKELLTNAEARIHPCSYVFKKSLSPHAAAAFEGVAISLDKIQMPESDKPIVVELAGGVAVPLNDTDTNLDLVQRLKLPVVIVSRHYLGSINHTLLTIEALRARNVKIAGVLFNGEELPDTERIIERLGDVQNLGRIPVMDRIDSAAIERVVSLNSLLPSQLQAALR